MTRGDQRNRNRDKTIKKKAEKHILPNNKVGKVKKGDTQLQKMKDAEIMREKTKKALEKKQAEEEKKRLEEIKKKEMAMKSAPGKKLPEEAKVKPLPEPDEDDKYAEEEEEKVLPAPEADENEYELPDKEEENDAKPSKDLKEKEKA